MSSILKALKKIENDSRPEVDIQSWPNRIDIKEIVINSRRSVRFSGKLFIFSAMVATVVFWVCFGFDRQAPVTPSETDNFSAGGRTTVAEEITAANSVFGRRKETKRSEASIHIMPETSETSPVMDGNEPAMIHDRDGAPILAVSEKERVGPEKKADKKLSGTEEKRTTASLGVAADKESATELSRSRHHELKRDGLDASVPANTGSAPAKERFSIRRLDDSILRLQAITWARSIEDRFALINDQIVRVGEPIGEFSVADIDEDHIIVQKGNERWRLEFRLR